MGFTLAEALITLSIIGIVAALTIPSLIIKNQEKETVVRLKKAYNVFSNAYSLAIMQYGSPEEWGWKSENSPSEAEEVGAKLVPFLNLSKYCGSKLGCMLGTKNNGLFATGVLSDGTVFLIATRGSCRIKYGESQDLKQVCGMLGIDINRNNRISQDGVDYFEFYMTKRGIIPRGIPDDTSVYGSVENGCNVLRSGCTAWVIHKENLDYLKRNVSWEE